MKHIAIKKGLRRDLIDPTLRGNNELYHMY